MRTLTIALTAAAGLLLTAPAFADNWDRDGGRRAPLIAVGPYGVTVNPMGNRQHWRHRDDRDDNDSWRWRRDHRR